MKEIGEKNILTSNSQQLQVKKDWTSRGRELAMFMSIKEQIEYAHKFAKDIKIGSNKVTYNPEYAETAMVIGQKEREKNLQDTLDYVLEFAIINEEFDLLVLTEYSCTECESISLLDRREEVDVCPYCTGSLYLTPGKSLNAVLYKPTQQGVIVNEDI